MGEKDARVLGFEALPREALQRICRELCLRDLGVASIVSKPIYEYLNTGDAEISIWRFHCERTFGVTRPHHGPSRDRDASFRRTCKECHEICNRYGSLGLRMIRLWARIQLWLEQNASMIADTLLPGLSENRLLQLEGEINTSLPLSVRALYATIGGQDIANRSSDNAESDEGHEEARLTGRLFYGVFGGMQVYHYTPCMYMLPADQLLGFKRRYATFERTSYPLFMSSSSPKALIYVERHEENVLSGGSSLDFLGREEFHPALSATARAVVPEWLSSEIQRTGYEMKQNDPLVVWLEAYAEAISSDQFLVMEIVRPVPCTRGIDLFPTKPPHLREAITQGIRVKVSTLFVPFESSDDIKVHAYSVRFSILPIESQTAMGLRPPIERAQLLSRHWIIRDSSGRIVHDIEGEGVIGEFPCLKAGDGDEYIYQSCTESDRLGGTMEGSFTFVEGSKAMPGPRIIVARCPLFQLKVQDVIF